jgi:hypothetical protein
MAKKNQKPVEEIVVQTIVELTPAEQLAALKLQKEALEAKRAEVLASFKVVQVEQKEIANQIKALYSSIVEDRKAAKVEKTNAKIADLQAKLATLTGATA